MGNPSEYMRNYMKDYRSGIKRSDEKNKIREQIKKERLAGEDIYTLALRYGYRPESICRLCQDLPIKKHANRHKLFYGFVNK
jgi:hypothetical protein